MSEAVSAALHPARLTSTLLGRVLITDSQMLTWMRRPNFRYWDMTLTCQYVR